MLEPADMLVDAANARQNNTVPTLIYEQAQPYAEAAVRISGKIDFVNHPKVTGFTTLDKAC